MFLGMSEEEVNSYAWRGSDEGEKMKEEGTINWNPPNTGATNESGFTGIPGGRCQIQNGLYEDIGYYGLFWSASENGGNAWYRQLGSIYSSIARYYISKNYGHSIRCLQD